MIQLNICHIILLSSQQNQNNNHLSPRQEKNQSTESLTNHKKIQSLTSVSSHTHLFSCLLLYFVSISTCNSNLYIGLRLYIQGPLLTNFLTDLTINDLYPQNVVNQCKNLHKIFKSSLFCARRAIFDLHNVV